MHVLTDSGSNLKLRMSMLKDWYDNGGVMILGYDMYRNLTQFKRIRSKRHKKIIAETLLDPGIALNYTAQPPINLDAVRFFILIRRHLIYRLLLL